MTQPEDFSTEQVEIIALALEDRTRRMQANRRTLEAQMAETREKNGHAEERRAEGYGNLQESRMVQILKKRQQIRQQEQE